MTNSQIIRHQPQTRSGDPVEVASTEGKAGAPARFELALPPPECTYAGRTKINTHAETFDRFLIGLRTARQPDVFDA
jgi:hypothetical protein